MVKMFFLISGHSVYLDTVIVSLFDNVQWSLLHTCGKVAAQSLVAASVVTTYIIFETPVRTILL